MTTERRKPNLNDDLRRSAENKLRRKTDMIDALSLTDAKKLAHELATHQIELEMQNDELRRTQVSLEEARSKYIELYDFAPVAYVTLDKSDVIIEANLTAAKTFGIQKRQLAGMPFVSLVAPTDRPKFLMYCRSITKTGISQTIELELLGKNGAFDVELISTGAESADGDQVIWVAFSDITKRKVLQAEIKASRDELEIRVDERTSMLRTSELNLSYLSRRLLLIQEEERKRLASALHDSVGQTFVAINLRVRKLLSELSDGKPVDPERYFNIIVPLIKQGIQDIRHIQADLRPPMLDELGINATMEWNLRVFREAFPSIEVIQELSAEEERIPVDLKPVLFRVFQEAFRNIEKHAQADLIHVSLAISKGTIALSISDNGKGFDIIGGEERFREKGSLGLISMKERTKMSGGVFSIQSTQGVGTIVTANWPLKQP